MLLPALSVGARGAIGSTYNFAAPLYLRLLAAFDGGDLCEARACQARAIAMIQSLQRFGGLPAFKATMQLIDVDCGPVRLPLEALTVQRIDTLRHELEKLCFFDWLLPMSTPDNGALCAAPTTSR